MDRRGDHESVIAGVRYGNRCQRPSQPLAAARRERQWQTFVGAVHPCRMTGSRHGINSRAVLRHAAAPLSPRRQAYLFQLQCRPAEYPCRLQFVCGRHFFVWRQSTHLRHHLVIDFLRQY